MFWFQFGSSTVVLLKAIELIEGLKKKVEADGVKQEEAYKKYKDSESRGHLQKFLKVYMYA